MERTVKWHQSVALEIHVCIVENVEILDRDLIVHVLKILLVSAVNMNLMLVTTTFVKMEQLVLIMDRHILVNVHLATLERIVKKISSIVKIIHVHQEQLASI